VENGISGEPAFLVDIQHYLIEKAELLERLLAMADPKIFMGGMGIKNPLPTGGCGF